MSQRKTLNNILLSMLLTFVVGPQSGPLTELSGV